MFGFLKRRKERREREDRDAQQQIESQTDDEAAQTVESEESFEASPERASDAPSGVDPQTLERSTDEPRERADVDETAPDTAFAEEIAPDAGAPPADERQRAAPSADVSQNVLDEALKEAEAPERTSDAAPAESLAETRPIASPVDEAVPVDDAPPAEETIEPHSDERREGAKAATDAPLDPALGQQLKEEVAQKALAPETPTDVETSSENPVERARPVEERQPVEQERPPRAERPPGTGVPTPATPEDGVVGGVASESRRTVRNRGRAKPGLEAGALGTEIGPETAETDDERAAAKKGWFSRMRKGLGKTRSNLTDGLSTLLLGHKEIDDDLLEELETQLLMADVGVAATSEIMENLEAQISRRELKNVDALYRSLQQELARMLEPVAKPLRLPPRGEGPFVILMVGVNGVGKTTTIGKLTQRFQRQGRSVMLAAGDTFRAAAVEQLQVWGERNGVPVIAQHTGADSASVIFDAVAAAKARNIDVLIADTAGRLHNKGPLMEELKKVQRVMARLDENAPHEVMLVLDAGTGQNAIAQAETFSEAAPVTGITLTKLDGTAKGGIIFAIAKQLGIPIRYIGVGETLDDLRPFEAEDFVGALFDRDRDGG